MKNKLNKIRNKLDLNRIVIFLLFPEVAFADFPSSLTALATGVVSLIFPAILMYEAGKAGLAFARKQPDAKEKMEHVALGTVIVLGINGVWAFIKRYVN